MAGFRIDINDARNAPVAPLEPPGGGSVPATAAPQVNDETNTARTIGEVVTRGPHEGIDATYDATTRAVRLRLTGAAQPGAMGYASEEGSGADSFPIPGPPGAPGRDGLIQVLIEEVDPEPAIVIQGPRGEQGIQGPAGAGGSGGAGGAMMPDDEVAEDWMWLAGFAGESTPLPLNGTRAMTGQLRAIPGSFAIPGYSFAGAAEQGFYLGALGGEVGLATGAGNFPITFRGTATAAIIYMGDNNGADFGELISTSTVTQLYHIRTTGAAVVDLDPRALDGSSNSTIRFNRATNTSGSVEVQLYRGNGSGTIDHRLLSGTTGLLARLCVNGGDVSFGGRLYGTDIHNNADGAAGATNGYIASGTYTPTFTHVSNIAASTSNANWNWTRVGNVVTVSGHATVDPTTASTSSLLGISFPIASAIASTTQVAGTACRAKSTTAGINGTIAGDSTNDRAQLQFFCDADAASFTWTIIFQYVVA
jgi:hypothetical protein